MDALAEMNNVGPSMVEVDIGFRSMSMRASIVKEIVMKKTDETNVGKMEAELRHWGVKLDKLIAKANTAGTEVKSDYRKGVEDLKGKYKVAQSKFADSKAAGGAKWGILKTGLEAAWNDLEAAFKKMGKSSVEATMANQASSKVRTRRVRRSRRD
jgi:hypothetical protein